MIAGAGQEFVGLQRGTVVGLGDGGRAGPRQQFVGFKGQGPLRSRVAGQGATQELMGFVSAAVLGLHRAGTTPPQEFVGFGHTVLLRLQLLFALSTPGGRIAGRSETIE